ncbi:MAG: type II toxin-antitoxin system RelE/ParE family toxin [Thermodesulfobacteriota bacterium]
MRARFLSPAVNEMFDAAVFYEKQVAQLGERFLSTVEGAVADLCEQPEGWPDIGDGVRRRPLRRFPYSVLYRIDEGEIVVVALMHQRRRPHYWIGRL